MISKEAVIRAAKTPMPWGGDAKKRKEMKGKPLLHVLFREPRFFFWVFEMTKNNTWNWLHDQMLILLEGIATIKPSTECHCGKSIVNWSVYKGIVNGHYVLCNDKKCINEYRNISNNSVTIVPHTFLNMYPYLTDDIACSEYINGFKIDYKLPARYNYDKYLKWLNDNL